MAQHAAIKPVVTATGAAAYAVTAEVDRAIAAIFSNLIIYLFLFREELDGKSNVIAEAE